jgi:hypothetical protein
MVSNYIFFVEFFFFEENVNIWSQFKLKYMMLKQIYDMMLRIIYIYIYIYIYI